MTLDENHHANRRFIRERLHAAHLARARGDRATAVRILMHAIAEGEDSPEANLRILTEEAARHATPPAKETTT